MIAEKIWNGNYLNDIKVKKGKWGFVTLVKFEGDDGKCYVSLLRENELPFKPEWYSLSLRGYHRGCDIPEGIEIEMKNPVEKWIWGFPENGAFWLCSAEENRNKMME